MILKKCISLWIFTGYLDTCTTTTNNNKNTTVTTITTTTSTPTAVTNTVAATIYTRFITIVFIKHISNIVQIARAGLDIFCIQK